MSTNDKGVKYWKDRFARERAEQAEKEKTAMEALRAEFDQKLEKLRNENKELREQPVMVEERSSGFMPFAVGCVLGLLIGG